MEKNNDPTNFEFGQVMSMLEGMDDGIKLIGEQHGEVIKRLEGVEGRLEGVEGRLEGVEGKIDRMQDDITEIKHRLADKIDREEFEKLEKRMVKIEQLVLAK